MCKVLCVIEKCIEMIKSASQNNLRFFLIKEEEKIKIQVL